MQGGNTAEALSILKDVGMQGKITEATLRRVAKLDDSDEELPE